MYIHSSPEAPHTDCKNDGGSVLINRLGFEKHNTRCIYLEGLARNKGMCVCALSMPLFYPRFQAFSAMRMCGDETLKSGKAYIAWLETSCEVDTRWKHGGG